MGRLATVADVRSCCFCCTLVFAVLPLFFHLNSMAVLKVWSDFGDGLLLFLSVSSWFYIKWELINSVFVSLLWCSFDMAAIGQLSEKCNLWDSSLLFCLHNLPRTDIFWATVSIFVIKLLQFMLKMLSFRSLHHTRGWTEQDCCFDVLLDVALTRMLVKSVESTSSY